MKFLILLIIKSYWKLIPEHRRKKCIFRLSCSQYVFQETKNKGFAAGIKAFRYRFNNCRHGHLLYENPIDRKTEMILPNGDILREEDISIRLIKKSIIVSDYNNREI